MSKFIKGHKVNVGRKKRPHSIEARHKMSLSRIGKKWTPETREKMKNRIPWNRGKTGVQKLSLETRRKISEKLKGNQYTKGKKYPPDIRKKFGSPREKHPKWKGGNPQCSICGKELSYPRGKRCKDCIKKYSITPINIKIRNSPEYRLWRTAVFERDNYQCIWGGNEHGKKIQADHIKPFSLFPELRFAIDNGRTLCIECHKKTDTYANKAKNYKFNN